LHPRRLASASRGPLNGDVRRHGSSVTVEISFGDNVRILRSPETEHLGVAELIGNVYGETTPSVTAVKVIGELKSDYALNVYFDSLDASYWFAPHMLEFVNHAPGTEIHVHGSPFKSVRQRDGSWKDIPLDASGRSWIRGLLRKMRLSK
jgi:hypothetical protein